MLEPKNIFAFTFHHHNNRNAKHCSSNKRQRVCVSPTNSVRKLLSQNERRQLDEALIEEVHKRIPRHLGAIQHDR